MRPLFRMWQEARLPPAERRLRDTEAPHTVRAGRPYKRRRAAAGHGKTPQREAGGICCMADNKPTNLQKSGPRVAGIQAVSGEGPAPRGSVPLRRKAGGSRADRQLSAACVAEYGVRRFKTDAHPALHTICRKRRSDRTSERDDIAVLISTRNPAGCKSRKNAKGRSSDSFRFRAFPA